jgi:hypothetical protein
MRLYNFPVMRDEAHKFEAITIEDFKSWGKDEKVDHLQSCIDFLVNYEEGTESWTFLRAHIDEVIENIREQMN